MQLVVVSAVSAAVSAATNIFASNSRIRFFVIVCCNFCVGLTFNFNDTKVRLFFELCKKNPDFPGCVKI